MSKVRGAFNMALFCLTSISGPAMADAQAPAPMTIPGLGTISFPTSTRSAAAESSFVRGTLLLHLFEYDDARAAFQAAQHQDSSMAMAYWGEAMTYTHPVWDQQDSVAARAMLARLGLTAEARERAAPTARERGYLRAVDILYGPGPKARRDTLYSEAMHDLVRAYPADDEARAFYALALLGLSQGVRNVPTYLRAAAIAESVFARNPRHPGAAHYWIHGMDDPDHGDGALVPARALSAIAPDAGHAQHMTAHIFMARGMWSDVVFANENAMRVVNAGRAAHGRPASFCGHYNFWLEYGYLQLGQVADARALLDGCIREATPAGGAALDPDNSSIGSAVGMWTRYLLDTGDWSGALAGWAPEFGGADPPRATWDFARGVAASRRGDVVVARQALADFQTTHARLAARLSTDPDPGTTEYLKRLDALELELRAEVQLAAPRPNADSAIALLRQATAVEDAMAYAFGPPFVDQPAHEMLGVVLLSERRYTESRSEFEAALRRTPARVAAVRGLERARAGMIQ